MTTPYTKLKEEIEKVLFEADMSNAESKHATKAIMSAIDEYVESMDEMTREFTKEEIKTNAALVDKVLESLDRDSGKGT